MSPDTSTTTLSKGRDALRRVRPTHHMSISHTKVVSARRAMYPRRPRRVVSERGSPNLNPHTGGSQLVATDRTIGPPQT